MNPSARLLAPQRHLFDRLVECAGLEDCDRLVERYPEAHDAELVRALCDEATKLVRVDVRRAEAVAELAGGLADGLGDAAVRARSQRARANVLQARGEHESALELYEQAVQLFAEIDQPLEAAITRSSALQTLALTGQHDRSMRWAEKAQSVFEAQNDTLRLGRLELNLGTLIYRQERFQEALEMMERAYDRLLEAGGPADVAHCLRNLATVHIGLKNFEQAEEVYARAKEYCQREDLPLLLGEIEYNIAYLYYLRGEYTTAIELYRRTRVRCEATGEHYHQALCDLDEGEIYLELNLIDETLRSTDAAYRSFERLGMHYEAAKALAYLAIARIRQGKTILGLGLFDRAREIFVNERNETWLGLIDLYKAVALAREGRRFEAEGLAAAAQVVFSAGGLTAKAAACEALRATLRLEAGEPAEARQLCDRALERLAELDLPSLEHQVLFISGRIEERSGNLEAALAAFEAAHQRLARSRSTAHPDELKIPLAGSQLEVYESLVSLLGEAPGRHDPERIFNYMEIAKARNMVDLLAFRGLALPTRKARSTQVERVRRLREELNWYYRRLDVQELAQQPSSDELLELRRQTRQTEDELTESLHEVEAADPDFASLQTASAARLEEIRSILSPDSALVELYTARDTIFACLLDADHLEVTPVSLASRVREMHQRFIDQLLKFRLGEAHLAHFSDNILATSKEILHDLYVELFEPLEGRLDPGRPLIVVPHGFLHWLPLSALFDGSGYLVDRHPISYAPTATALHRCCTRSVEGSDGGLLMAVPDGARLEAEALAAVLPKARVVAGADASVAALRRLAGKARIVHLATTAEFRTDNPMFSSIRLADDHLTLFDLFGLRLNAELTVLSGCGGSTEAPSEGDELLGLARGLLYAGSRSVMLPLWNPPAQIRAELLAGFYRALETAPSRSVALNRAMIEIRERHEHPYYWASFALIGDPGRPC